MRKDLIRISETIWDFLLIGGLSASDYLITPFSEGPVEDVQDSPRERDYNQK